MRPRGTQRRAGGVPEQNVPGSRFFEGPDRFLDFLKINFKFLVGFFRNSSKNFRKIVFKILLAVQFFLGLYLKFFFSTLK